MNTKKLAARNRRARRNLALKLQLEKTFKPEIKSYFNRLRKKIFDHYIKTGELPQIIDYKEDTTALLRRQYRRSARAFTNEMRLFINKNIEMFNEYEHDSTALFLITKQDEKIKDIVDAASAIFAVDQSKERANPIDRTTENNAVESIREATQQLIDEERPITNSAVAIIGARLFKKKNKGRVDTIALTETQYSSEAIKEMEAAAIASDGDIDPVTLATSTTIGVPNVSKEWAAILDQVTRESHVIADGQKVPMTDPFVVQGELLMRPGDNSLGASASNTINCRCSALYL